jgi:glycerate 2-kinase
MDTQTARSHLTRIFKAGLARVDPYRMMRDRATLSGNRLSVDLEAGGAGIDLSDFRRIVVIGVGKAAAPMARAIEEILGDRIDRGFIVVKYGHTVPLDIVETLESDHPVPDENGVAGARRIVELADGADEKTLVIGLISGGGSALLPLPLEATVNGGPLRLTIEDKQQTTKALLACGAAIEEINCIRKHLSGVKGGRLLSRLAPARSLNFILSDVVGDDLSSIASGITAPDPTTYGDALAIIEKYGIGDKVPEAVVRALELGKAGKLPETLKPGDPAEALATNLLIGTNRGALDAAADEARRLGYAPVRLTSRITGEARDAARFLSAITLDAARHGLLTQAPACILSGGEPTVTIRGDGKGGRNQEMALAFLVEMARRPDDFDGIHFLSAATDGNDGPTDAAGAFADRDLLFETERRKLNPEAFLNNNDAYSFFQKIGGLLKTGPTNTNVCDLQAAIVGEV